MSFSPRSQFEDLTSTIPSFHREPIKIDLHILATFIVLLLYPLSFSRNSLHIYESKSLNLMEQKSVANQSYIPFFFYQWDKITKNRKKVQLLTINTSNKLTKDLLPQVLHILLIFYANSIFNFIGRGRRINKNKIVLNKKINKMKIELNRPI